MLRVIDREHDEYLDSLVEKASFLEEEEEEEEEQ